MHGGEARKAVRDPRCMFGPLGAKSSLVVCLSEP